MSVSAGMDRVLLLPALLLAALLLACSGGIHGATFSRYSFPKDFIFGTGSSAIQVLLVLPCMALLHYLQIDSYTHLVYAGFYNSITEFRLESD